MLDVIRGLARDGTTPVVVTHEIGFAREVADRVVFLDHGEIVEQGAPAQVLRNRGIRAPETSSRRCRHPEQKKPGAALRCRTGRIRETDRPSDSTTLGESLMAINKKQVGVIVAGVAALALVGGGIAWAVGAGTSAAAESAASGSTEEQVQAASQFDLTSQNAKDRPTIEPVQAAVDALEASGFTPIEGQAHGRDLALGRAARRARLGRRRDRDRHGGGLRLLIADGLGLEYNLVAVNWADWPLGIQSGKYDLIASNVTVTEERKELYDFASYRQDLLGFYVNANSDIESIEGAEDIWA